MVILGGGKAGARAIVGLRGYGWEGSITLINAENLMPYDRPPLSKAAITDEAEPLPTSLLDLDMMHDALRADVHAAQVCAIEDSRGALIGRVAGSEIVDGATTVAKAVELEQQVVASAVVTA